MSKWQNWSISRVLNTINPQNSNRSPALSESQRLMYKKEKTENFRAVAQLFLSQCMSPVELTSNDLVEVEVQREIEDIGQFAELAHGKVNPRFVLKNLDKFMSPSGSNPGAGRYPLDGYDALKGSEPVALFYGKVESLQGYIAYRPQLKQLVIAFSGTSSFAQTRHNLKAFLIAYDKDQDNAEGKAGGKGKSKDKDGEGEAKIHAGFLQFYEGIRDIAFKEMAKALMSRKVDEVVFTGHSLGGAMAYLLALELMINTPSSASQNQATTATLPESTLMKVVVFGCPRIGNAELAKCWRDAADAKGALLKEYSVRGYNDGATAIPPMNIGYRHFSRTPFYLYQGLLYKVPPSQSEYTAFTVTSSTISANTPNNPINIPPTSNTAAEHANSGSTPAFNPLTRKPFLEHPMGGHNYYNRRDMERVLRLMAWFKPDQLDGSKEVNWNAYNEWFKAA